MVSINWTCQVKDGLKSISDYISRDSLKYAKLQVIRIRLRTNTLKTHPKSGRVVPEINKSDICELIEGNYRIIYRIVSKTRIDILTIHHSARDLTKRKI